MGKFFLIGLVGTFCLCVSLPSHPDEAKVEARIQKLGGRIERDSKLRGNPIVKVDLQATSARDADLGELKEFKSLRILYLGHGTPITDAGLTKLKTLISLEELYLPEAQITDAGVANLKPLTNLKKLGLQGCKGITDKSVPTLTTFKKLTDLSLYRTRITDNGVAQLQKALPGAYIGGGIANLPKTTVAERARHLKAQEGADVNADMIGFMSLLDGTEEGTAAAVKKYVVDDPKNYDLTSLRLENPHVLKTMKMEDQVCYTMQVKQGIGKGVYQLCWREGKVRSLQQVSLTLD